MFHPINNELWLRKSCRFDTYFTSDDGAGAAWTIEVSPSNLPPIQICSYPESLIYFCMSGRGCFDLENGQRFVIGPSATLRVPANTRHILRNELRDTWKMFVVMNGNTGAESFLDALGMTSDENELLRQAHAVGMDLHVPMPEPEPVAAIIAAENRISYPAHFSFTL